MNNSGRINRTSSFHIYEWSLLMKQWFKWGLLLLTLCSLDAWPAATMDPAPEIQVPESIGAHGAEVAIRSALVRRGWGITKQEPGDIQAMLSKAGSWSVKIDIPYSNNTITINYLDSQNLDYGDTPEGGHVIHRNYNRWMAYLVQDIQKSFAEQSLKAIEGEVKP
jgi:hypothetical protein